MKEKIIIGLGCRRCASSWLHTVLNQKNRICKPENGTHYFSENFDLGNKWYDSQFPLLNPGDVKLELSVSYLYPEYYETVSRRIHDYSRRNEVVLFAVIRNPIDRAFSDYLRSTRMLEIPKNISFETALDKYPEFIERGMYGKMLERYYQCFSNAKIKILLYDDLLIDPKRYLDDLFRFIGIENDLADEIFVRKESKGKKGGNQEIIKAISTIKSGTDALAQKVGCRDYWEAFKIRYVEWYWRVLSLNEKKSKMTMKTRKSLTSVYKDDIRRLEILIGRNLGNWLLE